MSLGKALVACAMTCCFGVTCAGQRGLKEIPSVDPIVELKTFLIPEGFEVNLYASDPRMAKPIQMNFDSQGRLWIAASESYPHIKPGEKASDKIIIVEDVDGDGVAEKTTVFADGLLIPTGVVPGDGGCYVANSTDLLHFQDVDGDGVSDKRRVVLSGFGSEDTHHLLHTLRWGPDGWLYMNQSIYIHSHIETPYGVKRLLGGGIWRFRPESMQLEVVCKGLVNPWGHHFDAWGQSFATDGAGGEGINYVFPGAVFVASPGEPRRLIGLNPGSPKHCGLEVLSGRHLPESWRGTMVANDFRANRVCRFEVTEDKAGFRSKQVEELIKSSHQAFRPIDVKMGPDGAIYIADWYNPIIQHGEVDFRDERRDHVHGRIWRITAKDRPLVKKIDVESMDIDQLLDVLTLPEQWMRLNAKLKLKEHDPKKVIHKTLNWASERDASNPNESHELLEALWVLQCVDHVDASLIEQLLSNSDHRIRAAAVRVVSHQRSRLSSYRRYLTIAVRDEHARVRLEAVRALSSETDLAAVTEISSVLEYPMDRFIDFATWRALRDTKHVWLTLVESGEYSFNGDSNKLLYALESVDSGNVAPTLVSILNGLKFKSVGTERVLRAIASSGGPNEAGTAIGWILANAKDDPRAGGAILVELVEELRRRRVRPVGIENLAVSMVAAGDTYLTAIFATAGAWQLPEYYDLLVENGKQTANRMAQAQAIRAIGFYSNDDAREDLNLIARSDDQIGAVAAIEALSTFAVNLAAKSVLVMMKDNVRVDTADALAAVLRNKQGATVMTSILVGDTITADVAKTAIRTAQRATGDNSALIAALRISGNIGDAGWKYSEELVQELAVAAINSGDPHKGQAVFRRASLQCMLCHAIGGVGGKVGPDLISIGGSAPVDYLVESLIDPNRKVKENYHSIQILDIDGQVYSGVPVRSNDKSIVIRNAKNELISIRKADIDLQKEARSLMPDGAVDTLTRGEIIDLVAFMSQLGKVGDFEISKEAIARNWQQLLWTDEAHNRINRTSLDTAANNDGALTWAPFYATVQGALQIAELPIFKPRSSVNSVSFLRTQLDVSEDGGRCILVFDDEAGLQLWVDGTPTPLSSTRCELRLKQGQHTITIGVQRPTREKRLMMKLEVPNGEPHAQWSVSE
jgi:putative heme-binding domain-containing protein